MGAKNGIFLVGPAKKSRKKTKITVFKFSGHLLSRYILHLGLKNTPGSIFEVPGSQNPVKKVDFKGFSPEPPNFFLYSIQNRNAHIFFAFFDIALYHFPRRFLKSK